ncbi:fimbrial protein [Caballeronia sp. Sq4a]|uniref:fimbrial protein n=1 Tax=Caballeronia sp. Sq4a TaxID=2878152 RepID=UPI0020C12EB7|nr:fimbrial protein [Caballeronia sp. Sq4a]
MLRILGVLAFFVTTPTIASADCPTTGLPATFSYGSIAVSDTLANGSVIPGTARPIALSGKCAASSTFNTPVVACPGSGTPVAGMPGVYPTNVAGIGMRLLDSNGNPLIGTGACSTTSSLGTVGADGTFNVTGTFQLVKTGPVGSGNITGATYYTGVLNTGIPLNGGGSASWISVASNTPVRTVTCSVTAATANQTVYLATISPSMLSAAGAVAARTPFALTLTCQSGVKVSVTFSSSSGNSGVASVLGNAGSAQGVGVQLLDSTQTPVTLDAPLVLTSSTTGNMSFPFYAQYYRLGAAAVVSGSVKTTAIFTMSYQ